MLEGSLTKTNHVWTMVTLLLIHQGLIRPELKCSSSLFLLVSLDESLASTFYPRVDLLLTCCSILKGEDLQGCGCITWSNSGHTHLLICCWFWLPRQHQSVQFVITVTSSIVHNCNYIWFIITNWYSLITYTLTILCYWFGEHYWWRVCDILVNVLKILV